MKFGLQTSLLTLVFAIGATDAFAAPTVRALGGTNTVAATGTPAPTGTTGSGTSMRSGSLRTVGGYVGPKATVSTSGSESSGSDAGSESGPTGSSVSSGAAGLNRASSTKSRLSVGNYIGAPKSVSTDGTDVDLSGKVDKDQGIGAAGNVLVVNNKGFVEATGDKVDRDQGTGAKGKTLVVNDEGYVEATGDKVDRDQGTGAKGKALIVNEEGFVEASGEFLTAGDVDLSGKVDKDQSGAAGNVLSIDETGQVTNANSVYFTAEMDAKLNEKLNNKADPVAYKNKALVVSASGDIVPNGDFVNADQGRNKAGKALVVGDDGRVTTGSINTASLGLGALAYKDQIVNADVADGAALERSKMAADITDTLYWIDRWRNREPVPDEETRYVMAVDEYGTKSWFRVVTSDND